MHIKTASPQDRHDAIDERRAAMAYVAEAFAEATLDGIEEDCLVQAALFTAFQSLVETYGEDAAATFAERLPERIRHGEFSIALSAISSLPCPLPPRVLLPRREQVAGRLDEGKRVALVDGLPTSGP